MQKRYWLAGALMATACAAQAGTAVIRNAGQAGSSTLEYRGAELLRMATDERGYMLNRDGSLYFVSGKPGQQTVIKASTMMSMFGGNMPLAGASPVRLISLEKTGERETVAGIKGRVWKMQFINEQGKTEETTLVLSSKKRVIELRDAMHGLTLGLLKSAGKEQDIQAAEKMMDALRSRKLGILRYGDEMEVTSLSADSVPNSRFELPAEPMQMPNISGLLGNMSQASGSGDTEAANRQQASDSAASDYAKEKAERQEERVKDRADTEVDKATDKAVDKAIDKVLGKLFGG